MGFADIAVEAGWNAVADTSVAAFHLRANMINGGGVITTVSTAVEPSRKD
jgi:hypothetical protein